MKGVNRLLSLCASLLFVFLVLFCISVIITLLVFFLSFLGSAYTPVQSKVLFPVDMNLLACLYLESFLSPSALACRVALQGSLHWRLWVFQDLECIARSYSACKVSIGKPSVILKDFPLYIICGFSLAAVDPLSSFCILSVIATIFYR